MAQQHGQDRSILKFAQVNCSIDEGFWHRLSSLKLNKLGIDDSPIPITGFYAPCSHSQVSKLLTLLAESIPTDENEQSSELAITRGNRNRCSVPGTLYNTNTLEAYNALDKKSLLKEEAKKIWDDIHSGRALEDSAVLSRFLIISFADLKKWSFHYRFAFPALVHAPPVTLGELKPASQWFTVEEAASVSAACNDWRNSSSTADVPFFLVCIDSNSIATIRRIRDWETCTADGQKVLFGFYDPCHLPYTPGWPLRNFLSLIYWKWRLKSVHFLSYKENRGFADLSFSIVGEALITDPQEWRDHHFVPNAVGWELNANGKPTARCISLAKSMDPTRLAISAADLNLKLMRWRALPSLDLDKMSSIKCLILGAGALGCQVARLLMAWGVRKITLVDNGKVAMSNPLRQSLYTFDDSLNGGEFKAVAAVKSLQRMFPAVEAEGVVMAVPMLGHPVTRQEEETVIADCRRLHDLVESHDAVFLLTDTRESRWLPSLLCSSSNKITITTALGFDSFLVMRHGSGPFSSAHDLQADSANALSAHVNSLALIDRRGQRLGCYFCSDMVAPTDSTAGHILDRQCPVSRPGLAHIASSFAVELFINILHHPNGIFAEGEISNSSNTGDSEQPLGILPHQIRGALNQFSQMTLVDRASNSCTACCSSVVSEYQRRGMEFLLEAINYPTYLEDISGFTELMKSAKSFQLDQDNKVDDNNDDHEEWHKLDQKDHGFEPDAAGWELNTDGKPISRCNSPAKPIDPTRLPISAADLNMKQLPCFNLEKVASMRCLLLGAGTLGCQVARVLMAWGVRKITLLDNGKVAMSNPLRQSLYMFDDCLGGGEFKAVAAVKSLQRIYPAVEAEGVVMAIPMPGHPVTRQEEDRVIADCRRLHDLVESHDAVFLLTDTRESRWLPSLLCSSANKITITAALGFDSFLVMRHGSGPFNSDHDLQADSANALSAYINSLALTDGRRQRLGCYFCNDVVAPTDSTSNRTLDQQCTVTRPALAPIASSLAVELFVNILHHPNVIFAEGEISNTNNSSANEQPLGILPHQIRGTLHQFSQMTLVGLASNSCTACCGTVVSEYRRRGMEFLLQAINHPTYLEDITGLTELMKSANSFQMDWDSIEDDDDDSDL